MGLGTLGRRLGGHGGWGGGHGNTGVTEVDMGVGVEMEHWDTGVGGGTHIVGGNPLKAPTM